MGGNSLLFLYNKFSSIKVNFEFYIKSCPHVINIYPMDIIILKLYYFSRPFHFNELKL